RLRSVDETVANSGAPDLMTVVQEVLRCGWPAGLSEEVLKRIIERLGRRAEVYLPGVLISLLQGVEPALDGNTVRLADQELAVVERMLAGQSKDDAVRDTLGLS